MAVPPIIHAERRVVRALRHAGAESAAGAQPLHALRPIDERAAARLAEAGALRKDGAGRWWADAAAYAAYRAIRRRRALVILAVVLAVLLVLVLTGVIRR